MTKVSLQAPAKINLTLEVLGKRPDGYHEIRSVMQTIALADRVTLTPADEISLALRGAAGPLAEEPPATNLTFRAAQLLRRRAGTHSGAQIELHKNIPIATGLGGGSSDAAATLRGLRELWQLDISDDDLTHLAAELGSDVPFFLRGGTALAADRGETVTRLPDGAPQGLVLAWPEPIEHGDKTARMYAALRQEHYTDGARTERLAERLQAGEPVRNGDVYNVFETILPEVDPAAAETFSQAAALGFGQPHLCGSGPAFFFLLAPEQPARPLLEALERLDVRAAETQTLSAPEAG